MVKTTTDKRYFPQLTGLRAMAAFFVFIFHLIPDPDHSKNNFLENFFATGYLGVNIFFVLSGFLICYRYFENFSLGFSWFKNYMINRVARIYPMYLILTTATFLYNSYFNINPLDYLVLFLNLTFLRGFFDGLHFTGILQGWSLTVEETFYILAPFIFLAIGRKWSFFILPLVFLTIGWLLVTSFHQVKFFGFMNNMKFMFDYTFFGRCIEFFLGIHLAIMVRRAGNEENKKSGMFRFPKTFSSALLMIALLLLLTWIKDYSIDINDTEAAVLIINNVLFPVSVYFFIYGLVMETSIIQKFLSTKLMELLGKSSYVFYLIHIGFITYFISDYFRINTLSLFITINLISIFLFYSVEEPLNRWIRAVALNKKAINGTK